MQKQAVPTCERVISLIVFVNPPLVLSEYLESLIELLQAVRFVVLYMEETAVCNRDFSRAGNFLITNTAHMRHVTQRLIEGTYLCQP